MWFRKQKRSSKWGGDCIVGNVLLTDELLADDSDRRLRKRLGARLFELADEHLTQRQSALLHNWSRGASIKKLEWKYKGEVMRYSKGGWVTCQLGLIFDRVRRLADDDMECQLLIAALGWRFE